MIRLAIIAALALEIAWILCYGALRTAQRIAAHQQQQIQTIESNQ